MRSPSSSSSLWPTRVGLWLCVAVTGMAAPMDLAALTLQGLLEDPRITAKKFAGYFSDFRYEYHAEIQSPEDFLARERGDCDDYAVLADFVLRRHGLNTRLIHVRLAGRVAHAVCYVNENGAYLDYNNRSVFFTLTRSGQDLRDIATKVADSLEANWTTASEFSYSYETRRKVMLATVSKTGGGDREAGRNNPFHVE